MLKYIKNLAHKGGVDTLDHLLEIYSCRRKTNRWTLNTFFYMIDCLSYNSYCLYKLKNKESFQTDSKRKRGQHLLELAHGLIKPCIDARVEKLSKTNFNGIKSDLVSSFKIAGAYLSSKLEKKNLSFLNIKKIYYKNLES